MINVTESKNKYFESVAVNELKIDSSYQKPLSEIHVRKIVKNYDPAGVGQIHVSKRIDGSLWVFDGQHRVAAFREMGLVFIDAIVYEGLTLEEESKAYLYYNTIKTQNQLDKFKAELLVGVPETVKINDVVRSQGLAIDYNRYGNDPIKAVAAIKKIYKKGGEPLLVEILSILRESFGKDKKAYQSFILQGLEQFLDDHGEEADRKWLIKSFKKQGLTHIITQSAALKSAHAISKKESIKLAIVKVYNHGRRKTNKL
jgi:hypothetical protein